ncbi:MAG: hypothetical protein WCL39_15365, partial [Armatimonadota bacterium]
TPPAAIYPVVFTAWYRPTWGAGLDTPPWAFLVDTRTPLGTGPIEAGQSTNYLKTWADLVVWTSTGFNAAATPTIYLHVIPAIGVSAPPTVLGTKAIDYKLVMTQWPTSYVGAKEFVLSPTAETLITLTSDGTTAADPISGTGPLAALQTVGYRFNVVAGNWDYTTTIADAKLLADGQYVALVANAVTYASADFFYVEEAGRNMGIRVEKVAHGLAVGMLANVSGTMATHSASRERRWRNYYDSHAASRDVARNIVPALYPDEK